MWGLMNFSTFYNLQQQYSVLPFRIPLVGFFFVEVFIVCPLNHF